MKACTRYSIFSIVLYGLALVMLILSAVSIYQGNSVPARNGCAAAAAICAGAVFTNKAQNAKKAEKKNESV